MRERASNAQGQKLARRAARQLPKPARALHLEIWLNEMAHLPTAQERLEYARGLKQAAREIRCELDPEGTFIRTALRGTALLSISLILLSGHTHARELLQFLALTLAYGMGVLLFSHLTTKCLLILPEVRRVWWRFTAAIVLCMFCAAIALGWFIAWTAAYPSSALLLLVCAVAGVQTARHFHVPRTLIP